MSFKRSSTKRKMIAKKFRVFATWRKDLCHINKVRDNHFKFFGEYFELTLLVPSGSNIGDHILESQVILIRIPCPSNPLLIPWFYFSALCFFIVSHTKQRYDAILSPIGEEPIGWFLKFFLFRKLKLIYDLWDIPGSSVYQKTLSLKTLFREPYNLFISKTIKQGDLIISGVREGGLERFNIPSNRIVKTENGVLLDLFDSQKVKPTEEIWEGMIEGIKILYIGYLHETRGTFDIVKAVSYLRSLKVDACLLLVGPSDSHTIKHIRHLKCNNGSERYIRILDSVPSGKIPGIIASADICVSPIRNIEKFRWSYPIKIYEYLAMGKPVIASKLPGTEQIIKDNVNGLLFPAGDVFELQKCIIKLIQDKQLYCSLSDKTRSTIAKNDWSLIFNKMLEKIYSHIFN